jgi:formiminotetrahydrofolate cyclodeaminase
MGNEEETAMLDTSLADFARACAAKEPTPGGGAAAAYTAALGAALARMALLYSLPAEKEGEKTDAGVIEEAAAWMDRLREDLLKLAVEDTKAYGGFSQAVKLPRRTADEKKERKKAVRLALEEALAVPLEAAGRCLEGLLHLDSHKARISTRLITDLGVAARCLAAGGRSCWYNVMVNAVSMKDAARREALTRQWTEAEAATARIERSILETVERALK